VAGPAIAQAPRALKHLSFTLGQEGYGIEIQKVHRLRGYDAVTHIANGPNHIKGVVNRRGVIVPPSTYASILSRERPLTTSSRSWKS
jgi:chemotaxis signal transduction protein